MLAINPRKSWAGSTAMLVGGFTLSLLYLTLFNIRGIFEVGLFGSVLPLLFICLTATLVEAFSGADVDNITIAVAALGAAWLLTDATGLWRVPFLG